MNIFEVSWDSRRSFILSRNSASLTVSSDVANDDRLTAVALVEDDDGLEIWLGLDLSESWLWLSCSAALSGVGSPAPSSWLTAVALVEDDDGLEIWLGLDLSESWLWLSCSAALSGVGSPAPSSSHPSPSCAWLISWISSSWFISSPSQSSSSLPSSSGAAAAAACFLFTPFGGVRVFISSFTFGGGRDAISSVLNATIVAPTSSYNLSDTRWSSDPSRAFAMNRLFRADVVSMSRVSQLSTSISIISSLEGFGTLLGFSPNWSSMSLASLSLYSRFKAWW